MASYKPQGRGVGRILGSRLIAPIAVVIAVARAISPSLGIRTARRRPARASILVLNLVCSLLVGTAVFYPHQAIAASAQAPWTPNPNYASGFNDEFDYSNDPSGSIGEYGIDVPLTSGTPIRAPQPGTVIAYQPCPSGTCWHPGRLIEQLTTGAVVAFGHVNNSVPVNTFVTAGQQIATVGDNGGNSHVEFMFDQSGSGGPGYYDRNAFVPSMAVAAGGCPRQPWISTGSGVDPCVVLTQYMHGRSSIPRTDDIALHDASGYVSVYTSTGHNFGYAGRWTQFGAIDWMGSGDFTGSGRNDIVIHDASNSFIVYTSTGSSFTYQGPWVSGGKLRPRGDRRLQRRRQG